VQRQQIAFLATASEGIDPGIAPHIAAVAAELAELDIRGDGRIFVLPVEQAVGIKTGE
jgi:nitrogen regulatory protein PII